MANVLLIEDDRSALHVMEAALRGAGHRVMTAITPVAVQRALDGGGTEIVVLDAILRGASGFDLLAKLRRGSDTSRVPVLLVTTMADPGDRARALSAGADDLLLSPFHPDELLARVHRLVAANGRRGAELEAQLGRVSLPELLQLLQHGSASGTLEVDGELRRGWVEIEDGTPVRARLGELDGRHAVLAMLDLVRGRVRFTTNRLTAVDGPERESMCISNLMFTAAWLADELGRRPMVGRDYLARPAAEMPADIEVPQGYEAVPVARVARCIAESPMLAVRELEDGIRSAPGMVRLAVALLMEQGMVTLSRGVTAPSDDDLLAAIRAVVAAVRDQRPDTPVVQLLLLVDDGIFATLLELRQRVPARLLAAPGDSLTAAWRNRRIAALPLGHGADTVIVHVAAVNGAEPKYVTDLEPYDGVVLWSADGTAPARLPGILDAVQADGGCGVIVVADRAAAMTAAGPLDRRSRWSLTELAPDSLAVLLQAAAQAIDATPRRQRRLGAPVTVMVAATA